MGEPRPAARPRDRRVRRRPRRARPPRERLLLALSDELRACRLHYQADEALQNIAYLHIAHGRVTRFTAIASALGSDHWRPIVTVAQAAITRGRIDVARATFAAADRPGMQQEYLRKRCSELTGAPPAVS